MGEIGSIKWDLIGPSKNIKTRYYGRILCQWNISFGRRTFLSTPPLRDIPLSRLRLVLTSFLGFGGNNYALNCPVLKRRGDRRRRWEVLIENVNVRLTSN